LTIAGLAIYPSGIMVNYVWNKIRGKRPLARGKKFSKAGDNQFYQSYKGNALPVPQDYT